MSDAINDIPAGVDPDAMPPQNRQSNIGETSAHGDRTMKALNEMRRNNIFCDLKLIVGSCCIQAHRNVLAAGSPYIRNALRKQIYTPHTTLMLPATIVPSALEQLIDYLYTGRLTIGSVTVQALRVAAAELKLVQVKKQCDAYRKTAWSRDQSASESSSSENDETNYDDHVDAHHQDTIDDQGVDNANDDDDLGDRDNDVRQDSHSTPVADQCVDIDYGDHFDNSNQGITDPLQVDEECVDIEYDKTLKHNHQVADPATVIYQRVSKGNDNRLDADTLTVTDQRVNIGIDENLEINHVVTDPLTATDEPVYDNIVDKLRHHDIELLTCADHSLNHNRQEDDVSTFTDQSVDTKPSSSSDDKHVVDYSYNQQDTAGLANPDKSASASPGPNTYFAHLLRTFLSLPPQPNASHLLCFDTIAHQLHRYDMHMLDHFGSPAMAERPPVPLPRGVPASADSGVAVALQRRRAYVLNAGGLCTVWDAVTSSWTEVATGGGHNAGFGARRYGFAVAAVPNNLGSGGSGDKGESDEGGNICLLGGHSRLQVCAGTMRYNVDNLVSGDGDGGRGGWRPLANMLTERTRLGAVWWPGVGLLAVGGIDGLGETLASCERYDAVAEEWRPCAAMSVCRSGVAVAVLDGRVYAVGGARVVNGRPVWLSSVEVLEVDGDDGGGDGGKDGKAHDPDDVPAIGKWRRVRDMKEARRDAVVVPWNGRLWVIGGNVGETLCRTLEVYDPERDEWRTLTRDLHVGLRRPLVCVLEMEREYGERVLPVARPRTKRS